MPLPAWPLRPAVRAARRDGWCPPHVAGATRYLFFAATTAIACSGLMGASLAQPFLFPSLGPTAYLFFERPHNPLASPRNTNIGHGVGILVGYGALAPCGPSTPPARCKRG
jgi:CBS-domain-containing membrane protein